MPSQPSSESSAGPDAEHPPASAEPTVKEQFLQALQRKQGNAAAGLAGGPSAGGKVPGAHARAGNKRQFRRKSGG